MIVVSDHGLHNSSAKDQLTGTNVAVKKIMKPFSTPVLSKRTYRELKLLKALRHENVSSLHEYEFAMGPMETILNYVVIMPRLPTHVDHQPERHLYFTFGRHVSSLDVCGAD